MLFPASKAVTLMHSYSKVGYCVGSGVGMVVGSWEVGRSVGLGDGIDDGRGDGAGVGTTEGAGLGDGVGITEGLGVGDLVGKALGTSVGVSVSNISQVLIFRDISTRNDNCPRRVPSA